MKKTLSLLALCTFAAAAANAETIIITPTSTDRETIYVDHNVADDLQLNSTGSYYKYTANNKSVQYASVAAKNGDNAGRINIAEGTLILDPNTTTENFTVLSAADLTMNKFVLTFQNSASSSTPLTVNFGSNLNVFSGASGTQTQTINFNDTAYNVAATTVALGNDKVNNISTLNVNSGSTVNWTGTTFNVQTSGVVNVNGSFATSANSTFNVNADGAVNVYGTFAAAGHVSLAESGAVMNVHDGATFSIAANRNFTMESGTTLTVGSDSSLAFAYGSAAYLHGAITSDSAVSFKKIETATGSFTQTAGGITFTRPATFDSGANWNVYEKITLNGNSDSADKTATLTVNDGAKFTLTAASNQRLIFSGNSELILNAETPFLNNSGNPIALVTTNSLNHKMYVNADQRFKSLNVNGGSSTLESGNGDLDVYLADGVKLVFEATASGFNANNAYLHIHNFQEESVAFVYTEIVAQRVHDYVKLYDGEDNFIGMGILGTDGWITAAIPEPATYAALLGALALGLAAYRRRK